MLVVKRARLKNMFQHRDLVVDLPPGMVGVTGPNGSGKSNLARAILFGLSGGVAGGARADAVGWGSCADSQVELALGTPAGQATLVRRANASRQVLQVGAEDKAITSASGIQERIEGWLNGPVGLLERLPFVPQEEQRALISGRHAARMDDFVRLFRLDQAATLRAVVVDEASVIPEYPDVRARIASVDATLAQCGREIVEHEAELARLTQAHALLKEAEDTARTIVALPDQDEVEKVMDKLRKRIEEIRGKLPKLQESDEDPMSLEELDSAMAKLWRAGEAAKELADIQKDKDRLQAPSDEELAAMKEERASLENERLSLHEIRTFGNLLAKAAQTGVCPICDGPVTEKCRERDRQANHNSEYSNALENLQRRTREMAGKISVAEMEIAIRSELLRRMEKLRPIAEGHDERKYAELLERRRIKVARSGYLADLGTMRSCEEKLEELAKTGYSSKEAKKQAQSILQELKAVEARITDRRVALAGKTAQRDGLVRNRRELEEQAELRERAEKVRGMLTTVKNVLHPDSLPKVVLSRRIDALNQRMAKFLGMFEAPFGLWLDPASMDFRCSFPDNACAPASAMSGGQKVIASLVFRFAFVELVGFGCGLWVLDEPTEFLDGRNRQMLMEFLKRAAGHFRSRELTLLIPTHDEGLLSACDSVVNLAKEV